MGKKKKSGLISEWETALEEREKEISKRETAQFQKEVADMRIKVAEENAALYKGRLQAAEMYWKKFLEELKLNAGICPVCNGMVATTKKMCNCTLVDPILGGENVEKE